MDPFIKRVLIILGIIVLGIVILIIGLKGNDPKLSTSNEYSDPSGPAILNNSEKLYEYIQNSKSISSFRYGLAQFARSTNNNNGGDIVFTIESANIEENSIIVEGKYSGSKDNIRSTIVRKNNGIIALKIENQTKNITMEDELTVNNKEDQFIGTLPQERTNYFLSYSESDGLYVVELKSYIERPEIEVEKDFESNLGRIPSRYEEYIILPPPKQIYAPN